MNWKNLTLLLAGIVIGALLVIFFGGVFVHERHTLAAGAGVGFWVGVGVVVAMAVLNWLVGAIDELGNLVTRKDA